MANLVRLSEFFKQHVSPTEVREILDRHNVRHVSCTLMPGRCGSTVLANLAEAYGFGTGAEVFNELSAESYRSVAPAEDFREFIAHALDLHVRNGIFYFQATPARMANLLGIFPLQKNGAIDIIYTLMFRRNIAAQAISYVNALHTGVWHSFLTETGPQQTSSQMPSPRYGTMHPIDWWIRSILRTELDSLKVLKTAESVALPVLYYEELSAAGLETFCHFLALNRQAIDHPRAETAFSGKSKPQRVRNPLYIKTYLDTIVGRPQLQKFLEHRATHGFDAPASQSFLDEFPGRQIA